MVQTIQGTSFIFEDQSSSCMCCDTVTAQCAKIPQGSIKTKRQVGSESDLPSHDISKEKKNIDQYLATSMKGLSVSERETALEEVNGIVDNDLETTMEVPAVIDQKLFELDQHLQRIKSESVYETAELMNAEYVQNRKFRIMFLRGRRYDEIAAAEQMLLFFESKLMLFGKDKLCKDITLDDMDEEDRLSIRKGGVQLLQRDVGGRMICTNLRGAVKHKSIINELRTKYYTFMSMVESEETQKKGAIAVLYVVGDYYKDKNGGSGLAKLGKLVDSLPIHWAGFHFCCGDMVQFVLIRALVMTFPKHLAAKFRCHKGTHLECVYGMRAYGIPPSCLPIPETGENKPPVMYQHMIWYQNREKIDRTKEGKLQLCPSSAQKEPLSQTRNESATAATIILDEDDDFLLDDPLMDEDYDEQQQPTLQGDKPLRGGGSGRSPHLIPAGSQSPIHESISLGSTAANTVITPRRMDVLFGLKYKHHPGTVKLQEIVGTQSYIFESISHRADKTEFVGSLVNHLRASGIRFLDMDKATNSWIEVDNKAARNKVAKVFRNKRRTTGMGPSLFQPLDLGIS